MKIGIDIRELEHGKMTGIGRYLVNVISYINSHSQHQLFLYGNQYTDIFIEKERVIVRIKKENLTLWWDQVILPKLVNEDRIDIFFSPYIKGPIRINCPLVVTMHDFLFLIFPEYNNWNHRVKNILFKYMAAWVGRRAKLILTDSTYSSSDIQTVLKIDHSKIKVLPIGVSESYKPIQDRSTLEKVMSQYDIDFPYIYYLGNFKPHKNVEGLIKAFAKLDQDLKEKYILVLGGKPDKWIEKRKHLVKELEIEKKTKFIGYVAEKDMPALYSGAEIFVFPSYYEGIGLPPLESMACGTAVVVSNRTSIPEVVGDAGFLIDPQNIDDISMTIDKLLRNDKLRCNIEQKGLIRSELFRSDDICKKLLNILESEVNG